MNAVAQGVTERIVKATVERLRALCAISSESGNSEGLRKVAELLSAELERLGIHTEIVEETDVNGTVQPVLFARGSAVGESHLLLIGHMDTVLPAV